MIIKERPHSHFQYDAALELTRVAWTGLVEGMDVPARSEHMLSVAARYPPRLYLLEISSLLDISLADQLWLGTQWLPRVARIPLRRAALLVDPTHTHNQRVVKALLALARPLLSFPVRLFEEPEAALRWLTDASPRIPELLAEWDSTYPFAQYEAAMRALRKR